MSLNTIDDNTHLAVVGLQGKDGETQLEVECTSCLINTNNMVTIYMDNRRYTIPFVQPFQYYYYYYFVFGMRSFGQSRTISPLEKACTTVITAYCHQPIIINSRKLLSHQPTRLSRLDSLMCTCSCGVVTDGVPLSMARGKEDLTHESFPEQLCMRTARMK